STLPAYVLDRCRHIEVRDYTTEEIKEIVKSYMIKELSKKYGFKFRVHLSENVISELVKIGSLRKIQYEIFNLIGSYLINQKPVLVDNIPTVSISSYTYDPSKISSKSKNKGPIGFCR
ncbi:MAG: hypothetical protein N2738_04045, partial [Thermodesulfovibrionales bacterium]|nr:hypothetical protein [Thermodesulfovibrionales bacterium]